VPSHRSKIRALLSGGDRRSIAGSNRVRPLIEEQPVARDRAGRAHRRRGLAVTQRALDSWRNWPANIRSGSRPTRRSSSARSQRATSGKSGCKSFGPCRCFTGVRHKPDRVEKILLENVAFPQTFVRAWALDSLATLAEQKMTLMPIVRRYVREFEQSPSKALHARARHIRARLSRQDAPQKRRSSKA
jgi:hypothetical protein